MSIFSNDLHTFVSWFESEITKFEKAAPTIEKDAEAAFTYATTSLGIVAAQITPGSAAAGIISKAVADLKTASAVVYDAGAAPSVGILVNDVVTNLGGLEAATGVKSASTVATVGKVVSTLAALASAFLAIVPAA